jgi:hypothetical protein
MQKATTLDKGDTPALERSREAISKGVLRW